MKKIRYILLTVFVSTILTNCYSQENIVTIDYSQYKNYDNYNDYQKDFVYLCQLLEDTHPNIYENFPKPEFEKSKENLLKELANIQSKDDYAIKLQQFVSKIKDAHTTILANLHNDKWFPIYFECDKDDIYILNIDTCMGENVLGAKVLAVNKMTINNVVNKLSSIISSENIYNTRSKANKFLHNPIILYKLGIIDSKDSLKLTIQTKNKTIKHIAVIAKKSPPWKTAMYPMKRHPVTFWDDTYFFTYKIYEKEKTCYFKYQVCEDIQYIKFSKNQRNFATNTLYHIIWGLRGDMNFKKFLKKMFYEINEKNITNLIIDIRENGGGSDLLGTQLFYYLDVPKKMEQYTGGVKLSKLFKEKNPEYFNSEKKYYEQKISNLKITLPQYLTYNDTNESNDDFFKIIKDKKSVFYMKEPKNKYKGNLYVLTSANTFSAAAELAIMLKDNNMATIIGTPTGQKPTQFGEFIKFELPLTKIRINISIKKFCRPDVTKNDEPTLYPDVEIWNTFDDYKNGTDSQFDKAFEIINH